MSNIISEPISNAEWEVMRVIWTLKKCLSRQIIEVLDEKEGWKPSTVKTLINRLVKKNLVKTTKKGRGFIYTPNVMEMKAVNFAGRSFFDSICSMDIGKEIGDVIDHYVISKSDVQMLIKKLQAKQSSAPEKVNCDCLGKKRMKNC